MKYKDQTDLAEAIEEKIESDYYAIGGAQLSLQPEHLMELVIDTLGQDAFPEYWMLNICENEGPNIDNKWLFLNDGKDNQRSIIEYKLSEPCLCLDRSMGEHDNEYYGADIDEIDEEDIVRQHLEDCLSQQSCEIAYEIMRLREYSQTKEWQNWKEGKV